MKRHWGILRKHPAPAKFLMMRLLVASGLCRLFIIQQNGYKLHFHPSNLAGQLWVNPKQREPDLEFFRAYLKRADKVIDVGANIGDTLILSAFLVGDEGHVLGIEAHPRTYRFLTKNIALNRLSNVTAIHCAVGAATGIVQFSDDKRDDMNRVGEGALRVPVETLDNLSASAGPISLLKVDVEGFEKFVLEGASKVLKETNCVFFEVCEGHFERFGYTTSDLLSLLRAAGFLIFRLGSAGIIRQIDGDYRPAHYENLLGLRDLPGFLGRTGWQVGSD